MRRKRHGHYFLLLCLGLALGLALVWLTTAGLGMRGMPSLTSLEKTVLGEDPASKENPAGEKAPAAGEHPASGEDTTAGEYPAAEEDPGAAGEATRGEKVNADQAELDREDQSVELELIFTGDILLHTPIINEGLAHAVPGQSEADFSWLFQYCSELFQAADLVVGNMEGTLTEAPYSGYPGFRVPRDLAKNLADAGFDACLTINNHALDGGLAGVSSTVDCLRAAGLEALGSRLSADEPVFGIFERQGIKLAITAFSYESSQINGQPSLNGSPIPPDYQALMDTLPVAAQDSPLYAQGLAECQRRIGLMQNAGADLIIFLMHWGDEYHFTPNHWQENLAQDLAADGVDLIIGSHPHVVQPLVRLPAQNQSGQMFCYYSLGNFVSSQQADTGNSNGRAEEGAIAKVQVKKDSAGCRIIRAEYIPLFMQKTYPGWPAENRTYGWALPAPQILEQLAHVENATAENRGPELPSPISGQSQRTSVWAGLTAQEREVLRARLNESVEQTTEIMGPPLTDQP